MSSLKTYYRPKPSAGPAGAPAIDFGNKTSWQAGYRFHLEPSPNPTPGINSGYTNRSILHTLPRVGGGEIRIATLTPDIKELHDTISAQNRAGEFGSNPPIVPGGNADISGKDFHGITITGRVGDVSRANLTNANIPGSTIVGHHVKGRGLQAGNMAGSVMPFSDLRGMKATIGADRVDLHGSNLGGAHLNHVNGANLSDATLLHTEFAGSGNGLKLNGAHGDFDVANGSFDNMIGLGANVHLRSSAATMNGGTWFGAHVDAALGHGTMTDERTFYGAVVDVHDVHGVNHQPRGNNDTGPVSLLKMGAEPGYTKPYQSFAKGLVELPHEMGEGAHKEVADVKAPVVAQQEEKNNIYRSMTMAWEQKMLPEATPVPDMLHDAAQPVRQPGPATTAQLVASAGNDAGVAGETPVAHFDSAHRPNYAAHYKHVTRGQNPFLKLEAA